MEKPFFLPFLFIITLPLAFCVINQDKPANYHSYDTLQEITTKVSESTNDIARILNEEDGYKTNTSHNVVTTLYFTIAVVGLVANFIVFFVIFCGDEINKTVTAIYVVQLAAADCIFLIALLLFAMQHTNHNWTFGPVMCTICQTIKFLNYYAGIFFLTAMSVDRYIAVTYSTKAHQLRTKSRTAVVCILIWIASSILSLPAVMYSGLETVHEDMVCRLMYPGYKSLNHSNTQISYVDYKNDYDDSLLDYFYGEGNEQNETYNYDYSEANKISQKLCQFKTQPTSYYVMDFTKFIVGFVVPFTIITVSYILIIKQLRLSEKKLENRAGNRTHNMRKRVTKMVAALIVCFALCWLPYHIFTLIRFRGIYIKHSLCSDLESFTVILGFANSSFNPILYTFLGHNFRERLTDSVAQTRSRLRRSSRGFLSGKYTLSRRNSRNKKGSFSKRSSFRFFGDKRESGRGLSTAYEADCATVVTENHAMRDGKRFPLTEMNVKKQTETPWRYEQDHQDEKTKCLSHL